jgi:apolipoprotein N-acyltransferase
MPALRALADRILAYPRLIALALGAVAACGFQPLALWPLTLLAVAGLVELVLRARSQKDAALLGWCFGLAHFALGNNWIATAFTYQANMPAWLGWIAVLLLAVYLAVYPALATWAAWHMADTLLARKGGPGMAAVRRSPAGALAFGALLAAAWIVAEWLRAWIFTGFAWNPLGIVLMGGFDNRGLAMLAPWLGTYALSGLVVLIAAVAPATARALAADTSPVRRGACGLSFAAFAIAVTVPMATPSALPDRGGGIDFTLVQPDVRQEDLDNPALFERHFLRTAQLSRPDAPEKRRVVFWPESGLPDYLRDGYPAHYYRQMTYAGDPVLARARIARVIGHESLLLTGATDLVIENDKAIAARNVITAIDGKGAILTSYSKAHLVPYGEYLAMRWLLEPLGAQRLVAGSLDFRPGPGPRTYDFGAYGRVGMQLCYEIIFSGQVVDPRQRPGYIFNPTNDGWFGAWGPPQHLAQARLRAIEEGLPVLRATTTGISAVIDADGIVRDHIASFVPGRIDGRIPYAHEPTLFSRFGNGLPLTLAFVLAAGALLVLHRCRQSCRET